MPACKERLFRMDTKKPNVSLPVDISLPDEAKDEYYISDEQARAALFNGQPVTLKFRSGKSELDLHIVIPNLEEQSQIARLATSFLGMRPEFASDNDYYTCRGRAVAEICAVAPFPDWLIGSGGERLTKEPVEWRKKMLMRPDTSECVFSGPFAALWREYNDVMNRFQQMV